MWLAASSFDVPEGVLATLANQQLNPKPHQGSSSKNPAPHPALNNANSTVALGLRASLALNGARQSERARYYGSALGRFTSPDQPFNDWDTADPQSWNLYGYVRNNPLRFVDPTGLDCITTSQSGNTLTVSTARGGSADTCSGTYVNGTVDTNSYAYNNGTLSWSDNSANSGGAMTIVTGSANTVANDWGPGSDNMRGAAQIGQTAPVGNALGEGLLYLFGLHPLKSIFDQDNSQVQEAGWAPVTRKIAKQMRKRGWTEKEINEALENKPGIPAMGKNGPATRYVNPTTGKSIVVDNATGEVFHVGDSPDAKYSDFDLPTPPEPPVVE